MFGFPTEREEERLKTIAFEKTLNPTYASFHKVAPYPGTSLFEMTRKHYRMTFPNSYSEEANTDILNQTIRQALLKFYVR